MDTILINNKKYIKVALSKDIFENKGIKIQFDEDDDFQLAIFRVDGILYCLENICPHRHADRIYEGIIKDMTVTCPLHGWTYSIRTGENINKRQGIKSLRKYECFEENGEVFVEEPNFEIPVWRRL